MAGRVRGGVDHPAPRAEPRQRVYSIGDIHGRLDLLQELHGRIDADAGGFDGPRSVVYMGDLIDRGMQSREVVDELLDNPLPASMRST